MHRVGDGGVDIQIIDDVFWIVPPAKRVKGVKFVARLERLPMALLPGLIWHDLRRQQFIIL